MTDTKPEAEPELTVTTTTVNSIEWTSSEAVPLFYVNNVEINAGVFDFNMKFGIIQKVSGNKITAQETARIIMSPQHAKVFAATLAKLVQAYEQRLGPIPGASSS